MRKNYVVLFSGGTGGHVIPAVNFGNYLIDQGYYCVLFLDKRGLLYSSRFKGKVINISSVHFSGNILFKFKSFLLQLCGLVQSLFYLLTIRPSNCIAFGSYASFMPLTVAVLLRILRLTQIHLHEQNSVIGRVNLFFLFFSKNIFINFDNIKNIKSCYIKKLYHVGLPYYNKIIIEKRIIKFSKEKKIKIFVYGGSQGSINLNNGFLKIIEKLPNDYYKKFSVVIQASPKQISKIETKLKELKINFKAKNFFNDIHKILRSCDIAFARSGAGTINDIIMSQTPSILVPLPKSVYDHQYLNAKYLFDKKAAQLVEEKDLNSNATYLLFKELFDNIDKRVSLINNLQAIRILDANKLIFKKIIK